MPRYLVTSALPYANGPIHFGHVIGAYLPADVYVRTLRQMGEDVRFVCGTDEHGVAITIRAEQEGVPYEDYVARWRGEIKRTFDRLGIEFDVWSGTSVSPCHAEISQDFFRALDDGGYLIQKDVEQLFCTTDDMFLADRYVVGTCYHCGHEEARGDECPSCGQWLEPLKMLAPRCKICGNEPERRTTRHWYLDLPRLRDERIGEWFRETTWKPNVEAFVRGMLESLETRPITRDMKWGVPVPPDRSGGAENKVLYVWFDAPIGYVSFLREWAEAQGRPEAWEEYWKGDDTRLVHFIGKDNIAFHCVVFPSMLYGTKQGYVLPWQVPAMEFYNLQGRKFSTSDEWSIPLDAFFERYDSEVTRFYLLASAPETSDSEWRWEDFQGHVALLADKIGNLATRLLRFIDKHFEGRIPELDPDHAEELDRALLVERGEVADPGASILEFRFRRATEQLLANAGIGNEFVNDMAPWGLRKTDPARAASVLNTGCEYLGWIARWMTPIMPGKAQALWAMLGQEEPVAALPWPGRPEPRTWRTLRAGQRLGEVAGLFEKIDDATVAAEIEELRGGPAR